MFLKMHKSMTAGIKQPSGWWILCANTKTLGFSWNQLTQSSLEFLTTSISSKHQWTSELSRTTYRIISIWRCRIFLLTHHWYLIIAFCTMEKTVKLALCVKMLEKNSRSFMRIYTLITTFSLNEIYLLLSCFYKILF